MDEYTFQGPARNGQQAYSDSNNMLNNINLYHGNVSVPLRLVSLEGPDGLSFCLQAVYSGILGNAVRRCNENAPTSVLGCGWSMALSCIGVMDKEVSRGLSADFYFISEGGYFPLYKKSQREDYVEFASPQHPVWEFCYYPEEDSKWVVCKEDGSRWIFGGRADNTELRLSWDNWTGPAVENGSETYPVGWYLGRIESFHGFVLLLEYENQMEELAYSAYTRNIRLKKVTTPYGETVCLSYGKKESWEYQTFPVGQEGYQSSWDDGYLDYVDVFSKQNKKMYTQKLSYEFYSTDGEDNRKKRYLTSVTQVMADGCAMPPLRYSYIRDENHCQSGGLSSMRYPMGAEVSFSFERKALEEAAGSIDILPLGNDWDCEVYHAAEYDIVKFSREKELKIRILFWDAGWKCWEDSSFNGASVEDVMLMAGSPYFIVTYRSLPERRYRVRIFRRNQARRSEWEKLDLEPQENGELPAIACGNDYYAIQFSGQSGLRIYQYDPLEDEWKTSLLSVDSADHIALGAGKDFLMGAYSMEGTSLLRFRIFYLDADKNWAMGGTWDSCEKVDWDITNPFSVWSVGKSEASAAFVRVQGTEYADGMLYLFHWRENYSFSGQAKYSLRQSGLVKNPLLYARICGSVTGYAQKVFRYLPGGWREHTLSQPEDYGTYRYAYGEELAMAASLVNGRMQFYAVRFDPVRRDWTTDGVPYCEELSGEEIYPPYIAGNYAVLGRYLFHRTGDGTWEKIYSFPEAADLTDLEMDQQGGYCLYGVRGQDGVYQLVMDGRDVREVFFRNGEIDKKRPEALPE